LKLSIANEIGIEREKAFRVFDPEKVLLLQFLDWQHSVCSVAVMPGVHAVSHDLTIPPVAIVNTLFYF
jgi:hypothetical protein